MSELLIKDGLSSIRFGQLDSDNDFPITISSIGEELAYWVNKESIGLIIEHLEKIKPQTKDK